MPESLLEEYIVQHIEAAPGPEIAFSCMVESPPLWAWTFFRKAVELQRKHRPPAGAFGTVSRPMASCWTKNVPLLAAEGSASVSAGRPGGAARPVPGDQGRPTESPAGHARIRPPAPASGPHRHRVRRAQPERRYPLTVYRFSGKSAAGIWAFFRWWSARPRAPAGRPVYSVRGGLWGLSVQDLR